MDRLRDSVAVVITALALVVALFAAAVAVLALRVDDDDGGSSSAAGPGAAGVGAQADSTGPGEAPTSLAAAEELEPVVDIERVNDSLPEGFAATVAAASLPTYGTTIALDDAGGLYLGGWKDQTGEIYRLPPRDDGTFGTPTLVVDGLAPVTGLLFHDGALWVATRGTVASMVDTDGDIIVDRTRVVFDDLPLPATADLIVHANNGMAFGPDGELYFGIGASCNACVEESLHATVVRCDPGLGECTPYATGLRNVYEVAFNPSDGELFGADNGIDTIGNARLEVEDEINVIRQGQSYGFPFCWGIERGMFCGDSIPALAELTPHSAPSGIAFYTGDAFPEEYRNDLFVTLWGDTGRRVIRVELTLVDGFYTAAASDFARMGRPVDVVVTPGGDLLVLDNEPGVLYRVRYDG